MKRATAQNIVNAAQALNKPFDHLTECVRAIEDETERRRMLLFIGGMIADLYHEVTYPVLKKHPDLDPHYPNEPDKWVKPD